MARTWLEIQVVLEGGGGIDCDRPPGRTLIVGPGHTFEDLANAIDAAFARWDLSHPHMFELADGRRIGFPDEDFDDTAVGDHAALKVNGEIALGDEFTYVFDLGDHWRHHCSVETVKVDPVDVYGSWPERPVATWGWGVQPRGGSGQSGKPAPGR